MIIEFKVFEARFQDIYIGGMDTYRNVEFNAVGEFLKNLTIKSRGTKKTFTISYNHSLGHDLKMKIKERTSLKSIIEFNYLLRKTLIELFQNSYDRTITSYSLYFIEYNFSIIINIKYDESQIKIGTILIGSDAYVGKKINIHSTL